MCYLLVMCKRWFVALGRRHSARSGSIFVFLRDKFVFMLCGGLGSVIVFRMAPDRTRH